MKIFAIFTFSPVYQFATKKEQSVQFLPMDLNENKSELAGVIMGDGNLWTDNRHYRVELTGDPELDREYYKYLTTLMQEEFGEDPT